MFKTTILGSVASAVCMPALEGAVPLCYWLGPGGRHTMRERGIGQDSTGQDSTGRDSTAQDGAGHLQPVEVRAGSAAALPWRRSLGEAGWEYLQSTVTLWGISGSALRQAGGSNEEE